MPEENERTRVARAAAETALVRIVHHCGSLPEFVLGCPLPVHLPVRLPMPRFQRANTPQ